MSWRITCLSRAFACLASLSAQKACAASVRSIAFPSGWSSFGRRSPSEPADAVAARSASKRQRIDANVAPSGTPAHTTGTVVVVVGVAGARVVVLLDVEELVLDAVDDDVVARVVELLVADQE